MGRRTIDTHSFIVTAVAARRRALTMTHKAKSPHIASALSVIDILTVLYSQVIDVNKVSNKSRDRDRIIFSKGHAAAGYYAVMEQVGLLSSQEANQYCLAGSSLLGHVTHTENTSVELSTGSLGHGLPYGIGLAIALKKYKISSRVYVVMSDGECDEGTTWESALIARQFNLDNLTVVIDRNRIQSITSTELTLALEPFLDKWSAFGWDTLEIDGHNYQAIFAALSSTGGPLCVVANTTKGKGVSFMEDNNLWHYCPPSDDELARALAELDFVKDY